MAGGGAVPGILSTAASLPPAMARASKSMTGYLLATTTTLTWTLDSATVARQLDSVRSLPHGTEVRLSVYQFALTMLVKNRSIQQE